VPSFENVLIVLTSGWMIRRRRRFSVGAAADQRSGKLPSFGERAT
jgi:hypothetical protein